MIAFNEPNNPTRFIVLGGYNSVSGRRRRHLVAVIGFERDEQPDLRISSAGVAVRHPRGTRMGDVIADGNPSADACMDSRDRDDLHQKLDGGHFASPRRCGAARPGNAPRHRLERKQRRAAG